MLRDSIRTDAAKVFFSSRDFAEPVVYRLRSGGKREFYADIERNPDEIFMGDVALLPDYVLRFPNDSACGVLASEIDQGDTVEFSLEANECIPGEATVMKILSHDRGVCTVALKGG